MKPPNQKAAATLPLVRCAIYTRKSTEEGLEQEFNSLDAQRESAEAFIRSQAHENSTTIIPHSSRKNAKVGSQLTIPLIRFLAEC
jgi:hypothetical protein